MNCPKCESSALPTQKFCRSCGTSLQLITKPLAESFVATGQEKSTHSTSTVSRQWPQNLMLGGFMTMFIGFATFIIGGTMIQEESVMGTGMLIVLAGMFLIGFANLWRRTRAKPDSIPLPEALNLSQPTAYLNQERNVEYVPSITERTTSLLQYPASTKSNQQED